MMTGCRSQWRHSLSWSQSMPFAAIAVAGLVVVVVGIYIFPLMLDDAYITYSSARNLARIGRLVYHPTNPELNISAPLYAVLLGIGGKLGVPIPALSNALGVASTFGSSAYLIALCYRHKKMWAAATAGLLLATSPMLWLTLGLETCFFLLLGLSAFYHFDREHYVAAAVLTACAILTRGDGILVAGLLGLYHLIVLRRRVPWNAVLVFVVVMIPVLLYLTLSFGSPLPTTLQTKQAQAAIGYSGFYVETTILQGLPIMMRGWLDQSFLYVLWLPLTMLGLSLLLKSRWSWGIVAWGGVHFASYALLDVAPYPWYYAPLAPGAVLLIGLALQKLAGWVGGERVWLQFSLGGALLLCLVLAQAISLKAAVSGINAERPPKAVQFKVVPQGATADFYRAIGEWFQENTPPNATVAVNDVGIIGFYADRAMIDFMGILQPDVAQAVGRNDLFYAVPHYLPDYILLGEKPVIYNRSLKGDPWFEAYYKPIKELSTQRFEQFEGSPLIVYQRVHEPMPMVEQPADIELLPGLTLDSFAIERGLLEPGSWTRIRMNWNVSRLNASSATKLIHNPPSKMSVYLTNNDKKVVAERSFASMFTTFQTNHRAENEVYPIYTAVHVPNGLAPGTYSLWLRIEEEGRDDETSNLTYEHLEPLTVRYDDGITLRGFALGQGEDQLPLQQIVEVGQDRSLWGFMQWEIGRELDDDYVLSLRLHNDSGENVYQIDNVIKNSANNTATSSWSENEVADSRFYLDIPTDLQSGSYEVRLVVYNFETQEPTVEIGVWEPEVTLARLQLSFSAALTPRRQWFLSFLEVE